MRPWAEASSWPPLARTTRSRSSPGSRRARGAARGSPFAGIEFAHREVGAQRLAVVGERHLELGRDGALGGAGVALGREAPAEDRFREGAKSGR
jgi:hypothetical protein